MRLVRLFEILDDLRAARRPVTAVTLAERYDVSLRTIYRDMKLLQSIGAPINGEGGIGYQIEDGFFLPPLHFNEDELDSIILGLRMISNRSNTTLKQAASTATGKIADVLPKEVQEKFIEAPLLAHSGKASEIELDDWQFTVIRHAIRNHKQLEITYQSLQGERSQRVIHPLGLTTFDEVWILTAWCELRKDYRNFRVDLLTSLKETGDLFQIRPNKSFQDYLRKL